jgi:alpha-2-macroglobulin
MNSFKKIAATFSGIFSSPNFRKIIVAVMVLSVIAIGYLIWESNQPKPEKVRMSINAPDLTPMRENAKPDSLIINFSKSAAKLEEIEKVINEGIEISPQIEGEWKWLNDSRLRFKPKGDWPAGTEYSVELDNNLFPPHILLDKYEKSFKTPDFKIRILSNRFYIDPTNENLKHVSATVQFTHPVNTESFENEISLKPIDLSDDITNFQDREYKFKITYDDFFGKAFILSEALPMPEDNVTMKLLIDEGITAIVKGEESSREVTSNVTIPGISTFIKINSISQTMVRNEEYKLEQIVVINTKGKARIADLHKNIEAWILPRDLPASPGTKAQKHYRWYSPTVVSPEVLKLSTKLKMTPLEGEHEFEDINSFKIKIEPTKYLYVKIKKGTPFYGKYNLSKDYDVVVRIQPYPKQLEIMHDGVILSSTGEKKLSIMAQGVEQVEFRIGRVQPDQLNHLVSQSNGDITNLQFENYYFSEENIVENYYHKKSLQMNGPGEPTYFSFDFSLYLSQEAGGKIKNGIFFLEVREWDKKRNRSTRLRSKRLIMISDLGVLVKDGTNNSHDIFVQSIATGTPVYNAKVQVLGKNGIPVLTASTDAYGHVAFPSYRSFNNEKEAVVYLISKGNDLSFMPVQAPGRWLNYSQYDIGGVYGATDPKKINCYLFSDRGIYRPGDEFHIGMIVKSGDWKSKLAGTPLEAAVIDARGLEIYKKKFKLPASGFAELDYKTEDTSPTGTYQVNLFTIRKNRRYHHIGSTTIKVEEFLPDRLAITCLFPGIQDLAWTSPDSLQGLVTLRNLFGSPARGNRISARISLSPGRMWFRPYRDFTFSDPFTHGKYFTEDLPEKFTDEEGKALFDFDLNRFETATYSLSFMVDGFEKEGGRNVSTHANILVSPLPYLVGTKADGDLSYIYKNSDRIIKIIAINPQLKKIAVSKVQFELNEIRHTSVLTKLPNETYAYKSVRKKVPIATESKNIKVAGLDYKLKTENPGEYELIIKNENDIQFSRITYSVVGMGNITRSLDKTAELEIKLNKTDYQSGEEIEVYVKAPYKGSGLITIERDKIYTYKWFQSQSNSFLKKITLPAGLEGNGYVNVSFVRAADSKEIYMSPLSYGVAPFSVSKKNRMNDITIDVASQARSGEEFPIKYKSDSPGEIVIFAVDEGILQVANYATPNPLAHFFKKRALEVRTSQLLDLILPEFSILRSNSAMGGGAGYDEIGKNLNPFKRKRHKPVVYWSGILKCDKIERTTKFTVPDYFNGTIRIMAVVVSQSRLGTFEERSIVKNPYIISPNVPMFAAPNDSFKITVTVTNGVAGSGKKVPVKLETTGSSNLKIQQTNLKLFIDENADTTVSFSVKALNNPGAASINFKAIGPKENTKLKSYLSVRPAIPYQTRVTSGIIKDGDAEVKTPRQLYEDFRVLNSTVSFLPVGLSKGLVTYLDNYPYGCTEQMVSQAFPYLFLKDIAGFGISDSKAKTKIKYALKVLQARQNSEGYFGIWAANQHTSDFITVYGTHFLTECKNAGYYVSDNLFNKSITALKDIAGKKMKKLNDIRVQAYAIYILTRNEIITTNYISSVRKILDEKFKNWEKDLSGGYLAGAYEIMKQEGEAHSIFNEIVDGKLETETPWDFCTNFIQNAQLLYLLSLHNQDKLEDFSESIISKLASFLEGGGYNTISSSYTIMALSTYSKAAGEPKAGKVSITEILRDESKKILNLPAGKYPTVNFSENTEELLIETDKDLNLYYQVIQSGFDTSLPDEAESNGIEVFREFRDKNNNEISEMALGDEVTVHLKFRSIDKSYLPNVAIVDLLPAGLEAIPTSIRSNYSSSWKPDHIDIREDRIILYGTLSSKVQEFSYKVRAINKGTFTVPPIYGESMYNRDIYGFTPQDPIVVE